MTAHFRRAVPGIDREEYVLWCADAPEMSRFASFDEAVKHFVCDFERRADPRLFRFNPACPEETRDVTADAISAMPEDDPYACMTAFEIARDRAESAADRQYQATREVF